MATSRPDRPAVFIIRLWHERRPDSTDAPRGYVEHVASGERRYFTQPAEALDFVTDFTDEACRGKPHPSR